MADILHKLKMNADADTIYHALATQAGLRSWWTADADVEDHVGGSAVFGFVKRAVVFRMTITELTPNQQVMWKCHGDDADWVDTYLKWEIRPDGQGCQVLFTHGDWKKADEHFASSNTTWGGLMFHLRSYVEGRNPGPHWAE